MIEFVKKEVWCFEENEASRSNLLKFFCDGHINDLVVIIQNNRFKRKVTYEDVLYDRTLVEDVVVAGKDVFKDAQKFYHNTENRKFILPVINENGELISFLRWNMQKKDMKNAQKQKAELIESADTIYVKECDENTFNWLNSYLKRHCGKKVILDGEGWDILFYKNVIEQENNQVYLYDGKWEIQQDELVFDIEHLQNVKVNSVETMWNIKEEYIFYRIYVWLENKADVDVLMRLAFSGVKIEGFCNSQSEKMQYFLGKPIVSIETVMKEADVLLIFGDVSKRSVLKKEYSGKADTFLLYEEIFELRKEIYSKETVILYDSVKEAKKTIKLLQKMNIDIAGTCTTAHNVEKNLLPKSKIFERQELMDNFNQYNIILASKSFYYETIISNLCNRNILFYVPSKDIFYNSALVMMLGNMMLYLDRALKRKKKIVLYGKDSIFTNAWIRFFNNMEIDLYKVMDNSSVYDLAYENSEDTYIIINKKIEQWVESCELLESIGFSDFNRMYTGLYAVSYCHAMEQLDVTLGYVMTGLLENTKYKGFRIYGENKQITNRKKYKVVLLGGSTTTAVAYRVPCWPELLYEKLVQEGYDVLVYNGGVDGYTAANELYKLIRDVGCLNPDLIISFSGVNNILRNAYPYVSAYLAEVFDEICNGKYCMGLDNKTMTAAEMWMQQEQMMWAISKNVYRARFLCFVQPMYLSKNTLQPWERLQFEENSIYRKCALEFRKEVSELAKAYDWMIDLQSFFDDIPNVFFDTMHVYKSGNQMIAENIFKYIEIAIREDKY